MTKNPNTLATVIPFPTSPELSLCPISKPQEVKGNLLCRFLFWIKRQGFQKKELWPCFSCPTEDPGVKVRCLGCVGHLVTMRQKGWRQKANLVRMEKDAKNQGSWWYRWMSAQALDSPSPYGLRHCHVQAKALLTEMTEMIFGPERGKPKMCTCYCEQLFCWGTF